MDTKFSSAVNSCSAKIFFDSTIQHKNFRDIDNKHRIEELEKLLRGFVYSMSAPA